MGQELDEMLGSLLREGGIPPRDPMFRIRVLERREHQRYRKRQRTLLLTLVATLVIPGMCLVAASALPASRLLGIGAATLFGAALLAAGLSSAQGMMQALRWIRRTAHR